MTSTITPPQIVFLEKLWKPNIEVATPSSWSRRSIGKNSVLCCSVYFSNIIQYYYIICQAMLTISVAANVGLQYMLDKYTGPSVKTTCEKLFCEHWRAELDQLRLHAAPFTEKQVL